MVYRAQVLGMVGVMGPEQEMQGWLQVLRDEREAARLGGRGVAAWKVDQAKREMDVLLTRQPNDEICGEFGRLLEAVKDWDEGE